MSAATSERVRSFFDPQVATRGEELALRGAVTIRGGDGAHVRAIVRGRLPYDTALTVTGGRSIVASCTCANAAFQLCKHTWATLRVAEKSGFLAGARHANDLAVYGAAQEETRPPALRWTVDAVRTRRRGELAVQLFERGAGPDGDTGFREVTGRRRWELQKYSLRALVETNACDVRDEGEFVGRLVLDEGEPFQLVVDVREAAPATTELDWPPLIARASLERDGEVLDLEDFFSFHGEDFVLRGARVSRVSRLVPPSILRRLRAGELEVPEEHAAAFLRQVISPRRPAATRLPSSFCVLRDTPPVAHVHVRGRLEDRPRRVLSASLSFDYDGARAAWPTDAPLLVDARRPRTVVVRNIDAERRLTASLLAAGFRATPHGEHAVGIPSAWLPKAVVALPPASFVIEADGIRYHSASSKVLSVQSGIDWFEVEATAEFGPYHAALPALLAAAKRGDGLVRLGDGQIGVLPQEWLARLARAEGLSSASSEEAHVLRFERQQVSVVDAILAGDAGGATWRGPLTALREELRDHADLTLAAELRGFTGTLRDYQRAGVAWLQWLERLGLSGCLADDMGLGKTVQVLALLADRHARRTRQEHRPSLVVAPRSVVHNWVDEAARFAPQLRVRELTGSLPAIVARGCDVLVSTYETLRRHGHLQRLAFDYVVLDEAHAIKNATSATSRAMCELTSRHRLALTGTPLENHLGEVASLFHFLNPGMLGSSLMRRAKAGLAMDADAAARLGRGLRPLVLRRTKEAVLKDLPPLVEQTVACAMDATQRILYERAKRYYQDRLRHGTLAGGAILEALLRLRQLACHPGLVDESMRGRESGKLEALFDRLEPLVAARKKAIVFSQFTSLLDLVGERCAGRGWKVARLDGQTADRRSPVTDFQTDPSCPIMLVSLRAGGTGLNLTAAEYVFLLDPWWNPAVEAQAVARAHRFGQERPVIAYRLLTTASVEERVAELQAKKRLLATSIFDATETAALGHLSMADLEELLR